MFCARVRAIDERVDAATIGDQLDFHIVLTQVVQQIFNVPEHLVGTALTGSSKMENHTVLVHSHLPAL